MTISGTDDRFAFGVNWARFLSVMHDLIDWIGGFPFEFARYDVLEHYMKIRGFELVRGKEATSLGCHEMVFRKMPGA